MFCTSFLIMAIQTGVYAYVWFEHYADAGVIGKEFWYRGNYVVIGQYALMLFLFYKYPIYLHEPNRSKTYRKLIY